MLKTNGKGTNILSLVRFTNYLMLKNVGELNRLFWSLNTTLDDMWVSLDSADNAVSSINNSADLAISSVLLVVVLALRVRGSDWW